MRYTPAIIVLFASMVVANAVIPAEGFSIPSDEADGVYSVYVDKDGAEVHELIAPSLNAEQMTQLAARDPVQLSGLSRIAARQSDTTACGGYDLDRWSTDNAVEALKNQCNPVGAINSGRSFYSIAGSTVAYICNYGRDAWSCSRNKIGGDADHITRFCGSYRAGWRTEWPHSNAGAQTGYEDRNARFCSRGTSG